MAEARAAPHAPARARRVTAALPAWTLAAALGLAYLAATPQTGDLAGQEYRAALGLVAWDGGWYGGHHVPAYSVLFPLLAHAVGARTVGVLAVVAAAAAFEPLARRHFGRRGRVGALWFALGLATLLVTGRLTFALGVALGLAAVLAAARGRLVLAPAAAVLTSLASPVAAAFLALAAGSWWLVRRDPRAVALAVASLAPAIALAVAFPSGGSFPFAAGSFWPSLAVLTVAGLALPRDAPVLRAGAALYGAAMVAAFLFATPMGGNVVRLGALLAGPVLCCALWGRRPVALAALAVPLLWWQWGAAVDDWHRAQGDPSVHAAYYAPLLHALAARGATARAGRLEIPFTANHWEARWVAPRVPLARGWERQLDIARNALFYDGAPLTAGRYRRWLDRLAIRWVALPDAPLDYSARAEATLVRRDPPYLREVWRDAHWRLYAVRAPAGVASGPGTAARLGGQEVALRARAPGTILLATAYSPYWRLIRGRGCVQRAGDGRVRLRLARAGTARIAIDVGPGRIAARSPSCTPYEAGPGGLPTR